MKQLSSLFVHIKIKPFLLVLIGLLLLAYLLPMPYLGYFCLFLLLLFSFFSFATLGIPFGLSKYFREIHISKKHQEEKYLYFSSRKLLWRVGIVIFFLLFLSSFVLGPFFEMRFGLGREDANWMLRILALCFLLFPLLIPDICYLYGKRQKKILGSSFFLSVIPVFSSFLLLRLFPASFPWPFLLVPFSFFIFWVLLRVRSLSFLPRLGKNEIPILKKQQLTITRKILTVSFLPLLLSVFLSFLFLVSFFMFSSLLYSFSYSSSDILSFFTGEVLSCCVFGGLFFMVYPKLSFGFRKLHYYIREKDFNSTKKQIYELLLTCLFYIVPFYFLCLLLAKGILQVVFLTSSPFFLFSFRMHAILGCCFVFLLLLMEFLLASVSKRFFVWAIIGAFAFDFFFMHSSIYGFYKMGMPVYYGLLFSEVIMYLVLIFLFAYLLARQKLFSFEPFLEQVISFVFGLLVLWLLLTLFQWIFPFSTTWIVNLLLLLCGFVLGFGWWCLFLQASEK